MFRKLLGILTIGLASLGGCMADPMPSPGIIDPTRIVLSATRAERGIGSLDVVTLMGLRGAVLEGGFLTIRPVLENAPVTFTTSADGSFAGYLAAAAGDELELTFRLTPDGAPSEPVRVTVTSWAQDDAPPALETDPNAQVGATSGARSTASRADGTVDVSGFGLAAGDTVVVGNVRTGLVAEATVDERGNFAATLAARSGDTLVVLVRSPEGLMSPGATLTVPPAE